MKSGSVMRFSLLALGLFGLAALAVATMGSADDSPPAEARHASNRADQPARPTGHLSESKAAASSQAPSPEPSRTPNTAPRDFANRDQVFVEARHLSEAYARCAKARGSDFVGVGVFVDVTGTPAFVKTGIDVPAEIHGPCFAAIGGSSVPGESSWGPPIPASALHGPS